MSKAPQFVVLATVGWLDRQQGDAIDYLREENRVVREQVGGKCLRLPGARRRRLAIRGKRLGRKVLAGLAGIATPDTLNRLAD